LSAADPVTSIVKIPVPRPPDHLNVFPTTKQANDDGGYRVNGPSAPSDTVEKETNKQNDAEWHARQGTHTLAIHGA